MKIHNRPRKGERGGRKAENPDDPPMVISPYLTELKRGLWPMAFGRIADGNLRRKLIASRKTHSLIFDHLKRRFAVISKAERELLADLAGTGFLPSSVHPAQSQALTNLVNSGLVIPEEEAFSRHRYDHVDIEINSHCNFRCSFCPVSSAPLPKGHMDPGLFRVVIKKVKEYGAHTVGFNHYGEPTLSPRLSEYVGLARQQGLGVLLFTNGSRLTRALSQQLAGLGGVRVFVNLPSAESEEFRRITRSRQHARVLANVRSAVKAGLPVYLSVNMKSSQTSWQRYRIRRQLVRMTGAEAYEARMVSRAGSVDNPEYVHTPDHQGRLAGCLLFLQKLSVNLSGQVFLCCNDYEQNWILGDLSESSLQEIVTSPRAIQLRRWIYGREEAPEAFICRQCEETRSMDSHLAVGHLENRPKSVRWVSAFNFNLRMRNLLQAFPFRIDEQDYAVDSSRKESSVPGNRFR